MSRYQFSAAQRYAIFTVHGERCYLCRCPIDLKTMQVDHIIPETLVRKPDELATALKALGRPATFEVNSYENWLPACAPCNNRKRESVFTPAPIIVIELDRAANMAANVRELEAKAIRRREIAKALNTLERAAAQEELGEDEIAIVAKLVPFHREHRAPDVEDQPLHLTPLYHVLVDDGFKKIIRGPYGVGGRPSGEFVDASWNCPNCGSIGAWSGARCVICGMLHDD